ncbi:Organic cation transporter 1, partial [Pseudolycoriella hygida]
MKCDVDPWNHTSHWISNAAPIVDGKFSKCERFTPLSVHTEQESVCPWTFNQSEVISCNEFVYLTDEHLLLNEFNLTCENNEWKLSLVGSLGYLAECISLPIIGLIADKYGRRPTLIGSIAMVSILGIAKTFSPNYLIFMILHFVGALFGGGAFGLTFVFGSEIVGPSSRGFGAGVISNAVSAGQMILAVLTMFITDFRVFLRTLFGLIALSAAFVWLVPESVRWLLSVNKHDKGIEILEKVAKWNGKKIEGDTLIILKKENGSPLLGEQVKIKTEEERSPIIATLKSSVLRNRLINCCYCFFTNALIYFGLSVYSTSLPGSKHMNLLYAGMSELPGNAAVPYVLNRFGRKSSLIFTMFACSLTCIASELLSNSTMKLILFLLGKFAVALSYTILNLYAIELFPTNLRQSMFNICMIFAGCGNILAPLLPLSRKILPSFPLILFAGTSFSSALLVLLLPETRNEPMPDTIEEAFLILKMTEIIEQGPKNEKLDLDVIYEEIGGFGKFQFFVYVMICIPLMLNACCNFSYIIIAGNMDYRCFIPECDVDPWNHTSHWISNAVPTVDGKFSKCERFTPLSVHTEQESVCPWTFNQSEVIRCNEFVYLTDEHLLLNEFNLTCENNEWKLTLVGSLGHLAECVSLPIIGLIADKYGRRPTLIGSIAMVSILGIAKTFSPNYLIFMIVHFVGALFGGGAFGLTFVFGSEILGPSSRGFSAGIIANAVSAGQMILAVLTMFITDFRVFLRTLFGSIALSLAFVWLVPESVRWLFSVNKYDKGIEILEKVAKWNGKKIEGDTLIILEKVKDNPLLGEQLKIKTEEEQSPIIATLKSSVLRNRLINCCYCFFTNSLIFCGSSVYSSSLPGSKHMNLFYAGMSELPGNAAVAYVLRRFGRKSSLIFAMFACSLTCIAPELLSNSTMKLILFLLGKFTIALSFTILNLYAIELFPTNLRQSMFNICMIFAGCGNILAPLLPLSRKILPSFPLILFAGTSFSSALLVLLLPETRNEPMPDTIEEA